MNATIEKFGYPATLLCEWDHWMLLLRPAQPTLASCVLAAKSDATAFGQVPPAAHAELADVTRTVEAALAAAVSYEKLNYLMLMMVDPHVHFHVIPRYAEPRTWNGLDFADAGWPKTPDLAQARALDDEQRDAMVAWIKSYL